MAAGQVPSPAPWVAGGLVLALLGYTLYQMRGFRSLCDCYRRLCDLKAAQRQLYRDLEVLQGRAVGLLARVPSAVRPAPYATDDERAITLRAAVEAQLAQIRDRLRPLDPGPPPRLNLLHLASGAYWRRLRAAEAASASAEAQQRELAGAQEQVGALAATLVAIARRPAEVQRGLADLKARAETLAEEIAGEERRGTGGLVALMFEVQAVRARALEWIERLRSAGEADIPQLAIEAEALRPSLTSKLWELLERLQNVAGVHDQALDWQRMLDEALAAVDVDLAGLRPAFAAVLLPAARTLREEQQALAARYGEHLVAAYQDVAERAWSLTARARELRRQAGRLAEAAMVAERAVVASGDTMAALQRAIEDEEHRSGVRLDLCQAAFGRALRSAGALQRAWTEDVEGGLPADEASALAALDRVASLAAASRQDEGACWAALTAWQAIYKRIDQVLQRMEHSRPEHERVRRAWRGLQAFHHSNWPQIEADWYDRYTTERQGLLQVAEAMRSALSAGLAESEADELRRRCDAVEQRWQELLHEGQSVVLALGQAQGAGRQAKESASALRVEVANVAETLEELPEGLEAVAALRAGAQEIIAAYQKLEDAARHPEQTDLGDLRSQAAAKLGNMLGRYRRAYDEAVESERAALKQQMATLWERWEPLSQRMAKATPQSDIEGAELQKRWSELLAATRGPQGLGQVLSLQARATALSDDVAQAQETFQTERQALREAEERLAGERREAGLLRQRLPELLKRVHPQVVEEEWDRSGKAWARAEALVHQLQPQSGTAAYLARLAEASGLYQEAHARARSALTRLVRYAFLEDPDGMREACRPLGRSWLRLGVTAREQQIRDLLGELERGGQVGRLLERIGEHFSRSM